MHGATVGNSYEAGAILGRQIRGIDGDASSEDVDLASAIIGTRLTVVGMDPAVFNLNGDRIELEPLPVAIHAHRHRRAGTEGGG